VLAASLAWTIALFFPMRRLVWRVHQEIPDTNAEVMAEHSERTSIIAHGPVVIDLCYGVAR